MKRKLSKLIPLTCFFILSIFGVVFTGCVKPADTKTVTAGTYINVTDYLKDGDTLFNIVFLSPDGKQVLISSEEYYLFEQGSYKICHSDGSVTELSAVDNKKPSVFIDLDGFVPQKGVSTALPSIKCVDNVDGVISDYTVSIDGNQVVGGTYTFNKYKTYQLKVTATDSENNVTEVTKEIECAPPIDYPLDVGTTVTIEDSEFFTNLNPYKSYQIVYSIQSVSGNAKYTLNGKTFTVADNTYYEVKGTATYQDEIIEGYRIYYPKEMQILTFNDKGNNNYSHSDLLYVDYTETEKIPAVGRVVENAVGNGQKGFNHVLPDKWVNWPLTAVTGGESGTLYFDLDFTDKVNHPNPANPWVVQLGGQTSPIILNTQTGRYSVHLGGSNSGTSSIEIGTEIDYLKNNLLLFDNVVFIPDRDWALGTFWERHTDDLSYVQVKETQTESGKKDCLVINQNTTDDPGVRLMLNDLADYNAGDMVGITVTYKFTLGTTADQSAPALNWFMIYDRDGAEPYSNIGSKLITDGEWHTLTFNAKVSTAETTAWGETGESAPNVHFAFHANTTYGTELTISNVTVGETFAELPAGYTAWGDNGNVWERHATAGYVEVKELATDEGNENCVVLTQISTDDPGVRFMLNDLSEKTAGQTVSVTMKYKVTLGTGSGAPALNWLMVHDKDGAEPYSNITSQLVTDGAWHTVTFTAMISTAETTAWGGTGESAPNIHLAFHFNTTSGSSIAISEITIA